MNRPWYQRFFRFYLHWILLGFLFVGSFLSTFSSAVEWVTPLITYGGTFLVIVLFFTANAYLKRSPLLVLSEDGQKSYIRKLTIKPKLVLLGVIVALWIPRFLGSSDSIPSAPMPYDRSSLEIISVNPEAGTPIDFTNLQVGIPISVVVEYDPRPGSDWEEQGVEPFLELITLHGRWGKGKDSWLILNKIPVNRNISRTRISGTLTSNSIYDSTIVVGVTLSFFFKNSTVSKSGYGARNLIEYPVVYHEPSN